MKFNSIKDTPQILAVLTMSSSDFYSQSDRLPVIVQPPSTASQGTSIFVPLLCIILLIKCDSRPDD